METIIDQIIDGRPKTTIANSGFASGELLTKSEELNPEILNEF